MILNRSLTIRVLLLCLSSHVALRANGQSDVCDLIDGPFCEDGSFCYYDIGDNGNDWITNCEKCPTLNATCQDSWMMIHPKSLDDCIRECEDKEDRCIICPSGIDSGLEDVTSEIWLGPNTCESYIDAFKRHGDEMGIGCDKEQIESLCCPNSGAATAMGIFTLTAIASIAMLSF